MKIENHTLPNNIFGKMNARTISAFEQYGYLKRFSKKEHIYWDGESPAGVYILLLGVTGIYKQNYEDKKVIFINKSYDILNSSVIFHEKSSISCEALTDVTVLVIPKQKFIAMMGQDFVLSEWVMRDMSLKMRKMYRQLKNTSNTVQLETRILSKLWKLARDFGSPCDQGIRIEFYCTVSYLADILGAKRESVSRKVSVLVKEGYILHDKGYFIVKNMDKISEYLRNS